MTKILILAGAAACLVSACTIREERTVQAPPAATVVAPAPANVVYADTPATTTTTVYTR